jgi:hypothetical protein
MARHIGHFCSLTLSRTAALEFQLRQCAFFVDPYQAPRARDIRRQPPLYLLAAQGAPRGSGKLNVHIAQLWAAVRLCPRLKWVISAVLHSASHFRPTPRNGHRQSSPVDPFRATSGLRLSDHLVSAQQERRRPIEPRYLGSLEIDRQLELGGLLLVRLQIQNSTAANCGARVSSQCCRMNSSIHFLWTNTPLTPAPLPCC